jgi:hypothetical protein
VKHQLFAGVIGLAVAGCASHEPPQPMGAWMPINSVEPHDYVVDSAPLPSTQAGSAKPAQLTRLPATTAAVPASARPTVLATPKPQGAFHDVPTR